jgi:hypothetical protein
MNPVLPLPHAWLLLSLDDHTGRSAVRGSAPLALAAAALAELELDDRLFAPRAHHIARRAGLPPLDGWRQVAESALPDHPVPLGEAMGHVALVAAKLHAAVLAELVAWGALREEVDRLWFVPYAWRWPTADGAIEGSVVDRLRAWVDTTPAEAPAAREDVLLSLVEATQLLGSVWPAEVLPAVTPRVQARTARAPLGRVWSETYAAAVALNSATVSLVMGH